MAKKARKVVPVDLSEMITLPEAAKLMSIAEPYLRSLVRNGKVFGFKFGRNYLVNRQSALAFKKKPGYGRPKVK